MTDCFTRQLEEIQAIQLIYPDEFNIDSDQQPTRCTFRGTITPPKTAIFEFSLPRDYPVASPPSLDTIYCPILPPQWLKDALDEWKAKMVWDGDYERLLEAVQWCLDQCTDWAERLEAQTAKKKEEKTIKWTRLTILFEHIKTAAGRKLMAAWAKNLCLSGTCRVGKPGIVQIEGVTANVDVYVLRLRSQGWGRFMSLTDRQDVHVLASQAENERRFTDFRDFEE